MSLYLLNGNNLNENQKSNICKTLHLIVLWRSSASPITQPNNMLNNETSKIDL